MGGGAVGGGANNVGGGQIAGVGVDNPNIPHQAEPGGPKSVLFKKKTLGQVLKRKNPIQESADEDTFAGKKVFVVDSDTFHKCKMGKRKYARWKDYVGDDEIGAKIKDYGYKYPHKPIILQDRNFGHMLHLRYGKKA